MTVDRSLPPDVVGFTGVYDADGGLRGELAYVVGHLLGRAECALCDLTHSAVRRKRSWDEGVAQLGVRFDLHHRNELSPGLAAVVGAELPCVVIHHADSTSSILLGRDDLQSLAGDVDSFFERLTQLAQEKA